MKVCTDIHIEHMDVLAMFWGKLAENGELHCIYTRIGHEKLVVHFMNSVWTCINNLTEYFSNKQKYSLGAWKGQNYFDCYFE